MIPLYQLFEDIEDVASAFKSFSGDKEGAPLTKKFFKNGYIPFINPGDRRAEGYAAALKKVAKDKEDVRVKGLETNSDKQFAKGIKSVKDAERDKEIAKLEKAKEDKLAKLKEDPTSEVRKTAKTAGVAGVAGLGAGALLHARHQKNKQNSS